MAGINYWRKAMKYFQYRIIKQSTLENLAQKEESIKQGGLSSLVNQNKTFTEEWMEPNTLLDMDKVG